MAFIPNVRCSALLLTAVPFAVFTPAQAPKTEASPAIY
jgi:hypothetical protein